ncbi:MAG TPA: DsrE family protein [Actinomycetota bacterium]|nr:DsrE family protein [Actinomycetota bacterium]
MGMLVIHASRGAEDPERATLPFVLGNNAAVAGQNAVILLTVEAVHLAAKGGADGVHKEGLPPLPEVMAEYVANGGAIWACQSCTKPRGIGEENLIEGARVGTSMEVVELLAGGAASFSF